MIANPLQGMAATAMTCCTNQHQHQHAMAEQHERHQHDGCQKSLDVSRSLGHLSKSQCSTCSSCVSCHFAALPIMAVPSATIFNPSSDKIDSILSFQPSHISAAPERPPKA
ncbi:hypothetical protein [Solimicrobium silvestre]|nr:hypothetical protein [Solimicrobium silvestre]